MNIWLVTRLGSRIRGIYLLIVNVANNNRIVESYFVEEEGTVVQWNELEGYEIEEWPKAEACCY